MKVRSELFDYGVASDEVAEKIEKSDPMLQDALMFLFFILNHLTGGINVVHCDGDKRAIVSYKGTKVKKLEQTINLVVNRAFPNRGNVGSGLSCRYIDDGRGYMFHLQVGI